MESNLPLVSIVAINYNNSKYVLDTLDSIARQTYSNIELIIIDDCSTDVSCEVIESWLKNYTKPFKFIRHEKNKGICSTCNSGFIAAKGEYISYIATDDIMLSEKIQIQLKELQSTDDDVAGLFSDGYIIDENGKDLQGRVIERMSPTLTNIPSGKIYDILINYNFIPPMTVLFKKRVFEDIGYFDENLKTEDRDILLRIARKYKLNFSKFISVKYRERKNSMSKKITFWDSENIKIYLKHFDHPDAFKKLRLYAKTLYFSKYYNEVQLLSNLRYDKIIRTGIFLSKYKVPKLLGSVVFMIREKTFL